MKKLLILGAGQYGLVAKEIAMATGDYDTVAFLDDSNPAAVGKLRDIQTVPCDAACVAMGNAAVRERWLATAAAYAKIATLVHPCATVMPSAVIGEGTVVEAGAVICSGATVGRGCIVMANAVIGHDAAVGDYCQIKYNGTVPERCTVPAKSKIDCNAVYSEEI